MRIAPWLMSTLMLSLGVQAAESAKPAPAARSQTRPAIQWTAAELDRLGEIEARAREIYPRRRDLPLRYLNISDSEVREIQSLAGKRKLSELVNIAPVVTGCPCEEGAGCTEQSYLVARFNGKAVGLQLSRLKNRWDVSRVQKWWLEYAALLARQEEMTALDFMNHRHLKLLEFPQCATAARAEAQKTSDLTTAAKK
jgi:hypothetical protein